jgi:hypothetical protein
MKALTLWQPWASLVATGAKTIETRSFYTSFRGPLAIHASVSKNGMRIMAEDMELAKAARLALAGRVQPMNQMMNLIAGDMFDDLPFGVIVATCDLVDCIRVDNPRCRALLNMNPRDEMFGDYSTGRYAWILTLISPLAEPVLAKGKQGLWEWDEVGL